MVAKSLRRGISLIEVLFSIGILTVGLLGVIAVVPVALDQIGRGNVYDRAASVGLNAEEEFYIRGMRDPNNWAFPVKPAANLNVLHRGIAVNPFASAPSPESFCIDPQFVAENLNVGLPSSNSPFNPDLFPYVSRTGSVPADEPRMQRISLRGPTRIVGGNPIIEVLRRSVADHLFTLDDELAFNIPDEKGLPPEQQFGAGAGRLSDRLFSWMATLVPIFDPTGTTHESYYLSIIVFHRRDSRMAMFEDTNANRAYDSGELYTFNESLAQIQDANFHGLGMRGGDVTMEAAAADSLELRIGDWVCLSRRLPFTIPAAPPPYPQGYFRWYRVVGTEIEPRLVGSTWERDVTLEGPDWPITTLANVPLTQAIIVRNVANVYERTIRLGR